MADIETNSVIASAYAAPADEPVEKNVVEEKHGTKQINPPSSKDDEPKSGTENPKLENSTDPEEESPPAAIEDKYPNKNVSAQADMNGMDALVTEPEALVAEEKTVEAMEKHAEKNSVKIGETFISKIKDEPATEGVKIEQAEELEEMPLETAASEKKPEEAEPLEKKPEDEVIEKAREEKPAVEDLVEEKLGVEQMQSVEDKEADSVTLTKGNSEDEFNEKSRPEKTSPEAVGSASEGKSASEGVGKSIAEDTPANESEESPTVKGKCPQEEISAKEASDNVTKHIREVKESNNEPAEKEDVETSAEEKTTGNEAKGAAAINATETELKNKQENQPQVVENVAATTEVQNGENIESVVGEEEEKISEEKLIPTAEPLAPTEEAQTHGKTAKHSSVTEAQKSASGVDVNKKPMKEEYKVTGKVAKDAKNGIIEEENETKRFKLGELMQEEKNGAEEANNADHAGHATKVAEKTVEKEQASKDVVVVKEKDSNIKEEAPTLVETNKEKEDSNAEATEKNPTEVEHKNGHLDVKAEDQVEPDAIGTTNKSDELRSDDITNTNTIKESSENVDNAKETQDLDTQRKAAPKQSGSIISKLKQSIVKVKKAIVKKSPSSKTLSPEVKSDGKEK